MNEREKAVWQIMKYYGNKKVYQSKESVITELKKCAKRNRKEYHIPSQFKNTARKCVFENKLLEPTPYYVFDGDKTAVVFLHGGAFSSQPKAVHWNFATELNKKTNATIYVPLYPLSPEHNAKETYNSLREFYGFVAKKHKKIYLIGDSAGATLALGLGHVLMNETFVKPAGVIPISPVVDMTFRNKKIEQFEKVDPILSCEGTRYICQKWARGGSFVDPTVSPIYGDYREYPKIYLFYGNYEILCPDLRNFVEVVKKKGGEIFACEENKCVHCYPLMPIPKGEKARDLMVKIITQKQKKNIIENNMEK